MSVSAKSKPRNEKQIKAWNRAGHEYMRAHPELRARANGEKNSNWRGGISKFPYPFGFDGNLKKRIKSRDGYICQLCSCPNLLKLGVHHIDYIKRNICDENLITLCRSCNIKVNRNRDCWSTFLSGIVRKCYENS